MARTDYLPARNGIRGVSEESDSEDYSASEGSLSENGDDGPPPRGKSASTVGAGPVDNPW